MSGQVLTQKILRPVGHDCGGVAVLYRDPRQEPAMAAPEQSNDTAPLTGPTM